MSHFAQAFWSADYAGGLGVLFGKLQQGVQENQQLLTITRMRAEAEDIYGQHMGDIGPATDKIQGGFQKDDGASTRKAYDGVRMEMAEASRKHKKIASNIRELVVYPFSRWCDQHATRVQHSQDELQRRVKDHDRQAEKVRKLRSQYFNKCRLVEDLEEENKLAFKEPAKETPQGDPALPPVVKVQEAESDEEPEPFEIGEQVYTPDQMKKVLTHMLGHIKLTETRVPILGTYQNVSTGADIVEYLQKSSQIPSMSLAEKIGQDLVNNGFLRLVGSVGSTFANSSKMYYQWRPKTFQLTGLPEKRTAGNRASTGFSLDNLDSPLASSVNEYINQWNPLNNPHPNETPAAKLRREAREADERYKAAVRQLDNLRCTLEEAMFEHLKFMERCELDRLKAIQSVILDFSGAISNVIPSLQATIDNMMLFQETVQPLGDLRYFLENYRTGSFVPKVQIYENYYNSVDDQTFGVDLEARAKADRRRVPLIITNVLTYLDHQYPLLDGDEARRAIWLVEVPLSATHSLRNEVNNGKPVQSEVLERYEVPIVASLLKLYLLELPDSIVSSSLYEVMKTIYSGPAAADTANSTTRVSVLQNALGQLRLANVASLDAITTHFARLLDLTSADDTYVNQLCQTLAPCVLRPRTESSLSLEERYSSRFLRDLLEHKSAIFDELKRAISLNRTMTVTPATSSVSETSKERTPSHDESNRRVHMEERVRAIASRSRANSPSPQAQTSTPDQQSLRNRRDSSRGPDTRFPVAVTASPRHGMSGQTQAGSRATLEVPMLGDGSPSKERDRERLTVRTDYSGTGGGPPSQPMFSSSASGVNGTTSINTASTSHDSPNAITSAGSGSHSATSASTTHQSQQYTPPTSSSPPPSESTIGEADVAKSNSLGRSNVGPGVVGRFPRKPGVPVGVSVGDRVAMARQRLEKRDSAGAIIGATLDKDGGLPRSSLDTARGGTSFERERESGSLPAISGAYGHGLTWEPRGERFAALSERGRTGNPGLSSSLGGAVSASMAGAEERRGVELVDKPMDD